MGPAKNQHQSPTQLQVRSGLSLSTIVSVIDFRKCYDTDIFLQNPFELLMFKISVLWKLFKLCWWMEWAHYQILLPCVYHDMRKTTLYGKYYRWLTVLQLCHFKRILTFFQQQVHNIILILAIEIEVFLYTGLGNTILILLIPRNTRIYGQCWKQFHN